MDLYKELSVNYLKSSRIKVAFPDLKIDVREIIELTCYQALQQIKEIIEDNDLSDEECFIKIEKIVCVFESIGSNGGDRHDFG